MKSENLYQLLASHFPKDEEQATVIETPDGRHWTYQELEAETARFARFFQSLGLRLGDRVAVQVEKSPAALFVYLACLRADLIYLPLNTAYHRQEIDFFLGDAEPALIIGRSEAREELEDLVKRHRVRHRFELGQDGSGSLIQASRSAAADFAPVVCAGDAIAALLYTSGTTGRPKGAILSHRNLAANALVLHKTWGFRATDVLLHALPLFHAHGLFVASHCALLSGAKMFFLPRFDAATVMRYLPRSTVFMGVPTYYTRLLAEPALDKGLCRNMRLFISGSAPLREQTFEAFQTRTGQPILERYGLTETLMNTSNPLSGTRKPGTVGPPLEGVTLRIANQAGRAVGFNEVGEIEVMGPNVFQGYRRLSQRSAEDFTADGFFRTGDLGKLDADGYVTIVGRRKDLIITGGYNVYPKEIEGYLDQLEGVQESAVIGLPDPDFGEKLVAVVVRHAERSNLSAEAVIAALKQTVANYKVPKTVVFVDQLPRNAMGKVQKNRLRERLAPQA